MQNSQMKEKNIQIQELTIEEMQQVNGGVTGGCTPVFNIGDLLK